jgi:hypothetical protein
MVVQHLNTPAAIWKHLSDHYSNKGLVSKLYLRKQLHTTHLPVGGSFSDYFTAIESTIQSLAAFGAVTVDEDT